MSDPAQAMVLAGSGRSGTTWISNIIAADFFIRVVFEPFDARHVPEASASKISLRPYCSLTNNCPTLYHFCQEVLSGHLHNRWVDQQPPVYPNKLYRGLDLVLFHLWGYRGWANRLLVKTIRANLMLGWLSVNFRPQILFLTRHPGAVVSSKLRLGWNSHLDIFFSQPNLVEDYLEPYLDIIKTVKSPAQQHVVMWCIENLVPLKQMKQFDWIFCTFEHFYKYPKQEAYRVLSALNLQVTKNRLAAIDSLSHMTSSTSALNVGGDVLLDWQRDFSRQEFSEMAIILREFGITLYDFTDPFPNTDAFSLPDMQ